MSARPLEAAAPPGLEGELPRWRSELGHGTRLWGGMGRTSGRHVVGADRFLTFSGVAAVDYNVVCCHGAERAALEECLGEAAALRRPVIVMAAGPALGHVAVLADAGWVCIGATPLMRLALPSAGPLEDGPHAPARPLDRRGLGLLRQLAEAAFALPPELAELALPEEAALDAPGRDPALSLWGIEEDGQMLCGTALVRHDDTVTVWSMATSPALQGRGLGRRLLSAALRAAAAEGATQCLLTSSTAGQRLYRAVGFEVLEHWQLWTRPRWVLA